MTQVLRQPLTRPASRLSLVPPPPPRRSPLTHREQRVLTLIADGCSTREVAQRMNYSERTIKNVLQSVSERLHYRNRTQAVACAVRNGWIQ